MTKQELQSELNHARRVISDLEKALLFVKHADPTRMYPGEKYATARTLGSAQGAALVALTAIPLAWRTRLCAICEQNPATWAGDGIPECSACANRALPVGKVA